jgi:hypothetical protein
MAKVEWNGTKKQTGISSNFRTASSNSNLSSSNLSVKSKPEDKKAKLKTHTMPSTADEEVKKDAKKDASKRYSSSSSRENPYYSKRSTTSLSPSKASTRSIRMQQSEDHVRHDATSLPAPSCEKFEKKSVSKSILKDRSNVATLKDRSISSDKISIKVTKSSQRHKSPLASSSHHMDTKHTTSTSVPQEPSSQTNSRRRKKTNSSVRKSVTDPNSLGDFAFLDD